MAPVSKKRENLPGPKSQPRPLKRKREEEGVTSLEQRVQDLDSKVSARAFQDLPLSKPTLSGLEASHYKSLTDIQEKAIPIALKGLDILGAAKTGSGKTLAFLVPVLENLYRQRWTDLDGLGVLILSPTRELAIQTFEVLRKIGRYHTFSAGLVIGGKSLQEEQERLGRMNILICTPGRMLQHMDQTAAIGIDNLQILVLDEADRIMDMGFQNTVDAIIEHLPRQRQTLLFSATQTKKVSDLARLSLRDPEYVSAHETDKSATPSALQHNYIIVPLPEKLDTLWSFIRANLKSKILVFLSSGKQVRFVYESFRHLQPGIPLLHLHGRQRQSARLEITTRFSTSKNSCLLATDIVARGLDFPAVDWVIQLDCPEDADTYIHRVGRTARYERDGRAVMFLLPSEEDGMLERLKQKKVFIERINVRQKKQQSIKNQLQSMCFKDPELKYLGQKAFVSYVKSIHVQKDKTVFKLDELPLPELAASFGLPGAPIIKFQNGDNSKSTKNASRQALSSEDEPSFSDPENPRIKESTTRTKYDRMFERRNQDVLADHYTKLINEGPIDQQPSGANADEGDFLEVKCRFTRNIDPPNHSPRENQSPPPPSTQILPNPSAAPIIIDSNRKAKMLHSKKKLLRYKPHGTKLVFDSAGHAHPIYELENEAQFQARGPAAAQQAQFLTAEQERLREADLADKQTLRDKRREKKEKRKARQKAERVGEDTDQESSHAVLVPLDESRGDAIGVVTTGDSPVGGDDVPAPRRRPKKWFEDDSGDEAKSKTESRSSGAQRRQPTWNEEPETLEDLEAVAAGLLD